VQHFAIAMLRDCLLPAALHSTAQTAATSQYLCWCSGIGCRLLPAILATLPAASGAVALLTSLLTCPD
jgi:hypothetical protein